MSVLLNPYINFRDNARQAMEFYQSVFGGELNVMGFGDIPGMPVEAGDENTVMHSQLNADTGLVLMAADTPSHMEFAPFNGSISLSGEAGDEATLRGYFTKLGEGGNVPQPLEKAPWGDTFGMLVDKFGVTWLMNIAGEQTS
jgi:PhnB protein